jgi:hypothetical protein
MHALQRRLEGYWRMELLNAIFLPAAALFVLAELGQAIGPLCGACLVPMAALLIAGGCYWRAKARQLSRARSNIDSTLLWLDRLERPLLVGCLAATMLCVADLAGWRLSVSAGDRWMAVVATALANLEYINHYHRQLQHFDHGPDFQRLLNGRGFRKSQMRGDLERFRNSSHARH